MRLTVKMFAAARDAVGASEVAIDVPDGATVAELRATLCELFPQVKPLVERAMFAVDARYAQDGDAVPAGAEVACIPPVSGG